MYFLPTSFFSPSSPFCVLSLVVSSHSCPHTMATNAPSFASPLASVRDGPQIEYVVDAISNTSPWTIAFTVLAVLVAYDQSMSIVLGKQDDGVLTWPVSLSHVPLEQGQHRGPGLQGAFHRTLPAIRQSQIRTILCKMEERPSELRLRFPQVRPSGRSPVRSGRLTGSAAGSS